MSKKFAKLLLVSAAIGSAVGAACYFIRKKNAELESAEEDYDDFSEEEETKSGDSRSYVPLTPQAEEESPCEESAADAEATSETPAPQEEAAGQDTFTPLAEKVAQGVENAEETVEEFFDEDSADEEPPASES